MAERESRVQLDELFTDEPQPTPWRGAPGKSTVTSRMSGPSVTNVIFRVANAEAASVLAESFAPRGQSVQRDANGVAEGAEALVDRAANTSGAPLPEPVREKFEASLGADLSGVRVHTGAESASAAKAVGARAYTVGQDIHFGSGQYGGSDPFSMHLLAHEVAHTVQQSRGGTHAPQAKLEVSSVGDAAEVEADRAADAMVSGKAAPQISDMRYGVGARMIARETINDGNYNTVLAEGEEAERDAAKGNQVLEGPTSYLNASNEGERSQASTLLGQVTAGESELLKAADDHEPIGPRQANNLAAKAELQAFIESAAKQSAVATQFEIQLQKVNVQYSKLEGMYKSATANLNVEGGTNEFDAGRADKIGLNGSSDTWDAKKQAKEQAVSTAPGTAGATKAKDDEITLCKANITRISADLAKFPNQIGGAVGDLKQSLGAVNAAVAKTNLPVPKMEDTKEQAKLKKHIDAAEADLKSAAAIINTATSVATTGFGAIKMGGSGGGTMQVGAPGVPVGTIEGGRSGLRPSSDVAGGTVVDVPGTTGSAGDAAVANSIRGHVATGAGLSQAMSGAEFGFVDSLAASITGYEKRVKSAQGAIDAISDANIKAVMQQAQTAMLAAKEGLRNTVEKLGKLRTEMEVGKKLLRAEADKLMTLIDGNKKKDGSGPDFGLILAFQTESTIFLADCDSAIQVGEKERDAAKEINPNVRHASKGAPSLGNNITNSRNNASIYWSAVSQPRPDKPDKKYWTYTRHQVVITSRGQEVMDKNMDTVMDQLKKDKTTITGFNATLKKYTGL